MLFPSRAGLSCNARRRASIPPSPLSPSEHAAEHVHRRDPRQTPVEPLRIHAQKGVMARHGSLSIARRHAPPPPEHRHHRPGSPSMINCGDALSTKKNVFLAFRVPRGVASWSNIARHRVPAQLILETGLLIATWRVVTQLRRQSV